MEKNYDEKCKETSYTTYQELMHSWNKGQQKNPNLTTERKFNHKKSGDDYLS